MHFLLSCLRDLVFLAVFIWLVYRAVLLWNRRERLAAAVFLLDGLVVFPGVPMALFLWGRG